MSVADGEVAQLDTVGAAVRALIRTERTVRTYPVDNALSQAALVELISRLRPALPLELDIHRDQLLWRGSPLLQGQADRSELPARLYRDGVRRISLGTALADEEIRRLLMVLATPIHPDDLSEDYVTKLWEADCPNVRVAAVDPFLDLDVPEEVLEGEARPTEEMEDVGPLPDQEVPPPPEQAFRIHPEDRQRISGEIDHTEKSPPWSSFIGALFDLLHRVTSTERVEELVRLVEATFYRLLSEDRTDVASELLLRVHTHLPAVADLPMRAALERMAHPERLESLHRSLETATADPEAAERLLLLLGERVPDCPCALLCSAKGEKARRFYVDLLVKIGLTALEPILQNVLSAPPDLRPYFARVLGRLRDSRATAALIASARTGDVELRKEALRGLAASTDSRALGCLLHAALHDAEPSVRVIALRCLGRSRAELDCRGIIERLRESQGSTVSETERDMLFQALGSSSDDATLQFLSGCLRPNWIPGKTDPLTWRRAASALARIGTPAARAILEQFASSRKRELARICHDALNSPADP